MHTYTHTHTHTCIQIALPMCNAHPNRKVRIHKIDCGNFHDFCVSSTQIAKRSYTHGTKPSVEPTRGSVLGHRICSEGTSPRREIFSGDWVIRKPWDCSLRRARDGRKEGRGKREGQQPRREEQETSTIGKNYSIYIKETGFIKRLAGCLGL